MSDFIYFPFFIFQCLIIYLTVTKSVAGISAASSQSATAPFRAPPSVPSQPPSSVPSQPPPAPAFLSFTFNFSNMPNGPVITATASVAEQVRVVPVGIGQSTA